MTPVVRTNTRNMTKKLPAAAKLMNTQHDTEPASVTGSCPRARVECVKRAVLDLRGGESSVRDAYDAMRIITGRVRIETRYLSA